MNNFFDRAFAILIGDEGTKYVNNPADSGGPTKFGITLKAFQNFVDQVVMPDQIENLTVDEAKQFYFETYWKPLSCDRVEQIGNAVCLFDSAVLYGLGTTAMLAQRALSLCGRTIKFDGVFGDRSVSMLNTVPQESFLKAFHDLILKRIDFIIASSPKNEMFRAGWTARADRILTLNKLVPLITKGT